MGNHLYLQKFHLIQPKVFLKVLIFKFIAYLGMKNLFESNWLIISIANKDSVVNLALKEDT